MAPQPPAAATNLVAMCSCRPRSRAPRARGRNCRCARASRSCARRRCRRQDRTDLGHHRVGILVDEEGQRFELLRDLGRHAHRQRDQGRHPRRSAAHRAPPLPSSAWMARSPKARLLQRRPVTLVGRWPVRPRWKETARRAAAAARALAGLMGFTGPDSPRASWTPLYHSHSSSANAAVTFRTDSHRTASRRRAPRSRRSWSPPPTSCHP